MLPTCWKWGVYNYYFSKSDPINIILGISLLKSFLASFGTYCSIDELLTVALLLSLFHYTIAMVIHYLFFIPKEGPDMSSPRHTHLHIITKCTQYTYYTVWKAWTAVRSEGGVAPHFNTHQWTKAHIVVTVWKACRHVSGEILPGLQWGVKLA